MARPKVEDPLVQKRLETKNQVFDKLDKLMERFEKRITLRNLRFAERFRDGELTLILHVSAKDSLERWGVCYKPPITLESDALQQIIIPNSKKEMMFVSAIELVEPPKLLIPTLVRFEPINSFFSLWPHSLYFSNLRGFVYLGTSENGKAHLSADFSLGHASGEHELICEMVKGATKVVNDIPSNREQSERSIGDGKRLHSIYPALAGLRIVLGTNSIRVLPSELFRLGYQLDEVLFGPFDLYPNKNDSVSASEFV